MNKAIFLDKDGTLVVDVPYNADPSLVRLSERSTSGLKRLLNAGYKLIIVSNQSGLAFGYFNLHQLQVAEKKLFSLLAEQGISIHGCYYCPHHPAGVVAKYQTVCTCRKPLPGLLKQAAVDHQLDLKSSWMIGDILNDVEAGHTAGCKTVLIDNGNETEWLAGANRCPDYIAPNIDTAANLILQTYSSTIQNPIMLSS